MSTKKHKSIAALTIGALGVVFGDIGTSPLYAVQAIFGAEGQHLSITQRNIYGILSLIIWSLLLVVGIKYIGLVMRADNEGEGGIMALVTRISSSTLHKHVKWLLVLLGIIGVSLFYGDSAITPAISVLSAVEGLRIVAPELSHVILPITLAILAFLFWVQRRGTGFIGKLFGPVMLAWFVSLAAGGTWQVWQHPHILHVLSPLAAWQFIVAEPFRAFLAMGAVVLAVTGAEALYADMGHFGRKPITRAWFALVFPALILCYMGQGALLLTSPGAITNPFFLIYPEAAQFTMVLLATFATLIASQAVISGAFSLTRQAIQLNFLPRMLIRHTSAREVGQIYVPFINFSLFVAVVLLVLIFKSSAALSHAYGIAVSGTLAIDTILFLVVMRTFWRTPYILVALTGGILLLIDGIFVFANLPKIVSGGWFPLLLALLILSVIYTWLQGRNIVIKERLRLEGSLPDYIEKIHTAKPPITRVPGQAVYINHHSGYAPLALHATVNELRELHEKVVIVSVETAQRAHVPKDERAIFDNLKYDDGISQLTLTYGFHDSHNIPKTLSEIHNLSPELDFDPTKASYFVSLGRVIPGKRKNISRWQKSLYSLMSRNELSASDYYKLPIEHTLEMRTLIEL